MFRGGSGDDHEQQADVAPTNARAGGVSVRFVRGAARCPWNIAMHGSAVREKLFWASQRFTMRRRDYTSKLDTRDVAGLGESRILRLALKTFCCSPALLVLGIRFE